MYSSYIYFTIFIFFLLGCAFWYRLSLSEQFQTWKPKLAMKPVITREQQMLPTTNREFIERQKKLLYK